MRYYALRNHFKAKEDRKRVVDGLIALRSLIADTVPAKDSEDNLLLATWNIRDFGKLDRRGKGPRLKETFWYIAQIISSFDIVAVQEVNELDEWEEVMYILGDDWDFIASDVTDSALGGNGERLTFVYDKRKVSFRNIAGEIVLPVKMLINKVELARVEEEVKEGAAPPSPTESKEKKEESFYAGKQFRRSPYTVSFQSGWFKFDLCTVHIYYGEDTGAKLEERIQEIKAVAQYFGTRSEKAYEDGRALILLGDFNIMHPEHKTMKALTDNGFTVPGHSQMKSNIGETKYYDQIAFRAKDGVVRYTASSGSKKGAGVISFFSAVFSSTKEGVDDGYKVYEESFKSLMKKENPTAAEKRKFFEDWRTYQVSDHKPLWVRLETNNAGSYLAHLNAELT